MAAEADRYVSDYGLSQHAAQRAQQRGVRHRTIGFIFNQADIELHAGQGLKTVRISRKKLSQLRAEGFPANLVEEASHVFMVVSPSDRTVVTVSHDTGSCQGGRYRKQYPTHGSRRRLRQHRTTRSALL